MSAVADYLHENYLHEQIVIIDEGIALWLKSINPKSLITNIDNAIKKKDSSKVEAILRLIPKSDFRTLYKVASNINDNFSVAFNAVKKEAGVKFSNLKGIKLDLFSLIFASTIVAKSNVKKASKEIVSNISDKLKRSGVKNFGSEAVVGVTILTLSGVLVAAALSTLSMTPMIMGIATVGLGLMIFMK